MANSVEFQVRNCIYIGLEWIGVDWSGLEWIEVDWSQVKWRSICSPGLGVVGLTFTWCASSWRPNHPNGRGRHLPCHRRGHRALQPPLDASWPLPFQPRASCATWYGGSETTPKPQPQKPQQQQQKTNKQKKKKKDISNSVRNSGEHSKSKEQIDELVGTGNSSSGSDSLWLLI